MVREAAAGMSRGNGRTKFLYYEYDDDSRENEMDHGLQGRGYPCRRRGLRAAWRRADRDLSLYAPRRMVCHGEPLPAQNADGPFPRHDRQRRRTLRTQDRMSVSQEDVLAEDR